ncbi:MAG TPA: pyruvate kinase [Gemmatimonadales bacterium]|nr:pyruvate kinase [Gemmatimonadales bacterium]
MSRTRYRRTKIVATLGPSWDSREQMIALLDAGVDVVRINASHGTPEVRTGWIRQLREVLTERQARGKAGAILVDLQGPRIRVGRLDAPVLLEPGQRVVFAPMSSAVAGELPTTYDALAQDVRPGSRILLDDGLLAVEVTDIRGDRVSGLVVFGGELRSNKGINLPGVNVSAPAISERDHDEVARLAESGVDYVAMSFVRRPDDLVNLRALLPKSVRLIAKIEKDTALENLSGILAVSDAIMVARGDLGVELPFEEVPLAQKRLIREANLAAKPVITATQMLESMIHAPRPTRAEVSDVANAILDGTDAVMLSAETAIGDYPLQAVQAMVRIAAELEQRRPPRSTALDLAAGRGSEGDPRLGRRESDHGGARTETAIAVATCAAADLMRSPVIVCFTSSGFTARTVASYRPGVPIFALTTEPETFRQLALIWGVVPALVDHLPTYEDMLPEARKRLLEAGLAETGDRVVVTAGVPWDRPGTTNLLKVETV